MQITSPGSCRTLPDRLDERRAVVQSLKLLDVEKYGDSPPSPGEQHWFFDSDNWEMLVKVLDACHINGQFLFLGAATTDVEYTLTVTDLETQVLWQHTNPLGNPSEALVHWFDTCQ